MKKIKFSLYPPTTFMGSLAAGLAAAGLMLCGNATQAQPVISSLVLPNAPNNENGFAVGAVQFQGALPPNANQLSFQVSSGTGVNTLTVQLKATTLPGVTTTTLLTPTFGLSIQGGNTYEIVTAPLAADTVYSAVITASDAGGPSSVTVSFDTLNPNYFTFEAEDFDYGGGQYYDSGPGGTFGAIDAYSGATATVGIDCNNHSGGNANYRTNPLETESESDIPRIQYADSGYPDFDVGFNNGGDWGNYTRQYPAGVYNIYLRGSGGNGAQANACTIGLVTSGYGTTNQATNHMGAFSVAGLGWQTYTWCPAIDINGNLVAWGAAGDQETLRFTVANGNCNENCYLLVPAVPTLTPNNTNVYQGSPVTLSIAPYALSTPAVQWQTDNGSGGTAWTSINNATNSSYALPTGSLALQLYEYQAVFTLAGGIEVTTAPVTLDVQESTKPVVVEDTYPPSATAFTGTSTSFTATFNGPLPIIYQWLVSSNSGVSFTSLSGQTNTTLVVLNLSAFTNEYELEASNAAGASYSTPATLTTILAPPAPPVQLAGDLIVELRSSDLALGAKTWTNRAGSAASVGNFMTGGSSVLTVSNNVVNPGTPLWGAYSVNALYVGNNSSLALFSAGLTPAEINTNGAVTMEAWIYNPAVESQENVLSYGIGGGSAGPAEEREFGYGTAGYAGFTADYGNFDKGWNTTPTVGWHYIAVTYTNGDLELYQDGVPNGNNINGSTLNTFQTRLDVGQGNNGTDTGGASPFYGYIAAARVMSGVLTPSQISTNFAAGLLAEVPVTVYPPTLSPTNSNVTVGNSVTLNGVFTTNDSLAYTYQWQWDDGSGGQTWTAISGATNATYSLNTTGLAPGTYEYELVLSNSLDSIVAVSSPAIITVVAATGPVVVQNPVSSTVYVNQNSGFTAFFTGAAPIALQWQVSADDVNWTETGVTSGSITVSSPVPLTNYYRLTASNYIATNVSAAAQFIALPAPPLQIAGDLIVNLQSTDLAANSLVWTNQTADIYGVGNFQEPPGGGVLNVSNSALNPGTPVWQSNSVNALYVDSTGTAVQSALNAPAEISTNGTSSGEAWIYATTISGNNSVIAYGAQGGSSFPEEDREMNWGAGSGCFSGDFGSLDCAWNSGYPQTGAWYYLAWTWDGVNAIGYVNGVQNVLHTLGQGGTYGNGYGGYPLNTLDTVIGVGAALGGAGDDNLTVDNYHGWIASARLSSGVLTPAQVLNNYNAGMFGVLPLSLGAPSLTPLYSEPSISNAITLGQTATLGVVDVTNVLYPMTYQWYTDNGSSGQNWTAINLATNETYVFDTTAVGAFGFEVEATNAANSIGAISPPTFVNVIAPAAATLVSDITPAGTTTTIVTVGTTFSASFSGSVPLTYQWQQSVDNTNWTSVAGATALSLTVYPQVPGTNYYRIQASNTVNTAYSSSAELVATIAPSLPSTTLAVAGDLIVNLQAKDLVSGASVWTNQTANTNSVGNFEPLGGGNLNVLSSEALANDYHNVNVLNIGGIGADAVQSTLLSPAEINGNGTVSMEAWVYATALGNQDTAVAYGVAGGSAAVQEERALEYGTQNYGAFTANYGNADLPWTTAPTLGWHYLVATCDGTTVTLYQDGVANATASTPASPLNTLQTYVEVGSQNNSDAPAVILTGGADPFDGYISAARVESGVLTAAQVLNNYNAGLFATVPSSLLPAPVLGASFSAGKITLTWGPSAVLVQATSLTGPWAPVPGATSPYQVTPAPGVKAMFYAVEQP